MPNLRISIEYLLLNERLIAENLIFLLRKINLRISASTQSVFCNDVHDISRPPATVYCINTAQPNYEL